MSHRGRRPFGWPHRVRVTVSLRVSHGSGPAAARRVAAADSRGRQSIFMLSRFKANSRLFSVSPGQVARGAREAGGLAGPGDTARPSITGKVALRRPGSVPVKAKSRSSLGSPDRHTPPARDRLGRAAASESGRRPTVILERVPGLPCPGSPSQAADLPRSLNPMTRTAT